jgi:hypothetical protein
MIGIYEQKKISREPAVVATNDGIARHAIPKNSLDLL